MNSRQRTALARINSLRVRWGWPTLRMIERDEFDTVTCEGPGITITINQWGHDTIVSLTN